MVRHKHNLQYTSVKELDLPDNRHQHILKDEIAKLKNTKYPRKLRRLSVWNDENKTVIEIITNQITWTANTISELYKSRWQIEIFFREVKQCLHIKSFVSTSENVVMIQIWTALITIMLLKAMKVMAKHKWHLSNLVAFIRLNLLVKIELQMWLDKPFEDPLDQRKMYTQVGPISKYVRES